MGWTTLAEAATSVSERIRSGARQVVRARGSDRSLQIGLRVVQTGPLLILALVVVVMSVLSPVFFTERNFTNLGFQTAIVAVLALGQLLVILTRGIDLSVGSTVALTGVLALVATTDWGLPGAMTVLLMLGVGAIIGVVNGSILIKGRIMNPFIVTLGMLSIVRGLALVISDGKTETGFPRTVEVIGTEQLGPVPLPTVLVGALAVVLWVLLRKTQWGRWIYAVGGNPEGARRVGIPVDRVLFSVYVLCGLAAGLAGILVAARTNAASPNAGQLMELDAITAVIIGGASFFGGRGNVWNVIAGALIIGVLRNGLNLLDVTPFWQLVAVGALVILSLELDVLRGYLEGRLRAAQARSLGS